VIKGTVTEELPCTAAVAFAALHDYDRRLEWDTLLAEAYLCDGAAAAGEGVVSVCRGRLAVGGFAMRTRYVSFDPPGVAAVKLLAPSGLFARWAASIRHRDVGVERSTITYVYSFAARPRWLAWLLEPIVDRIFRWETRRRLVALAAWLRRSGDAGTRDRPGTVTERQPDVDRRDDGGAAG
jgi:hypothetical protein